MRRALFLVLGLSLALGAAALAQDQDARLTGKITCARCELKKELRCMTVIVVKQDGKDVIYYFDPKSHKANHAGVCQAAKRGTVVGTVSEKDGKKYVTVKKVSFE